MAKEREGFKSERLLEMFQPFSGGVWSMMLVMFVFGGVVFWVMNEHCDDFDQPPPPFPNAAGFARSFWVSAMGYFGGNQFEVRSWPARIVLLGYSFFLATTIAAYTANLASFMVQQKEDVGLVSGLRDIVMRGKSLCVVPDVANMITEPGILERVVMVDSGFMGSMFEMMWLGMCDAALVGKMEYMLYAQAENMQYDICTTKTDPNYGGGFFCEYEESSLTRYDLTKCQCGTDVPLDVSADECPSGCVAPHSKFCDVIEVLDPSLRASLNIALPVADWFEPFVSAGIIASKLSGHFHQDYEAELTANNPPMCPSGTPQRDHSNTLDVSNQATPLSAEQMAGTFLISSVFMAVGLIVHGWELLRRRRASVIADEGDVHSEQHHSFLMEKDKQRMDWERQASLIRRATGGGDDTVRAALAMQRFPSPPPKAPPRVASVREEPPSSASALGDGNGTPTGDAGVKVTDSKRPVATAWGGGEIQQEEQLGGQPTERKNSDPEELVQPREVGWARQLSVAATEPVCSTHGAGGGECGGGREAELALLHQTLAQVVAEVRQIRRDGLSFQGSMQAKSTASGKGASFRKRHGR